MTEAGAPTTGAERRAPGEQRRYNRRTPTAQASPPYFEVFERIAAALERIGDRLPVPPTVTLPTADPSRPRLPRPGPPGPRPAPW